MRSFMLELARVGGGIALEHFQRTGVGSVSSKGRGDYVTHVDRRVEDAITTRIRHRHPDHLVLGEERHGEWPHEVAGPCWIIDPIDGTTNFIRGLPTWCLSICFCEEHGEPRHALVYDPVHEEFFIGERGAGLWCNEERVYTSSCKRLDEAILACALPFRVMPALDEVAAVQRRLQTRIDDSRRGGSAALDLAYVAVGRLDGYWELGVQPWDVAAGELLVRCGGGAATDLRGAQDDLLTRRSIVAGASPELHGELLAETTELAHWLDEKPYAWT